MKGNFWIPLMAIGALLTGFFLLSDHDESENDLEYREKIEQHRMEIDYFMRNAEGSPFAGKVEEYRRLSYYPVDENFRVMATFTPAQSLTRLDIATSNGQSRPYVTYGYLEFELGGGRHRLAVYQPADPSDNELFLGFGDDTSANETYGGGRYLNIEHEGEPEILLDFNLAYNPYCAYNEEFVCPFPPRENILSVAITAGEKNYKSEASVE